MQKVIPPETLKNQVESLIECFCELLEQADITAYESNMRAGKTLIMAMGNGEDD